MTNRWPDPGTAAPRVRSARTVTTALSTGGWLATRTSCMPVTVPSAPVFTVSVWAPPLSVTPGAVPATGKVMA
jgi:hypothetical protein